MKILKALAFVWLPLVLTTNLVLADVKSSYSKLDHTLRALSQNAISVNTARALNMLKEVRNQEAMVKTLIRFKENLNGVDALGGKIRSIIGDIGTVDIPLSSLEALSQLDNIVYVEASKKVKPKLDISVPETRAALLRGGIPSARTGVTGKDVIIGIVDSGIDLTHPDFKDETGKTRILYLLDQTTGQECTNAMIDDGTCGQIDLDGHGTHVAGIAAGNGSALSPHYKYVGMAPEANLIIVKCQEDSSIFQDNVLDGISYIEQKAASLSRPSVINLSFGQHVDPHDGTSNFSRGLDNATGPGRIIAGAAGNEAYDGIHASGNVTQGSQTSVAFHVPPMESMVRIDLWYAGSDSMNIEVITPTCGNTGWIAPNDNPDFTNACGHITVSSLQNNPNNGDNEILIVIENASVGSWNFSLQGISITNGRFDAWIDDTVTYATFANPDSSITLTDVGSTTKVISVGSYVTRRLYRDDPAAGEISAFSSHGPRRSCSTCDSVLKPEITAPGEWIMSALSIDYVPYFDDVLDSSGKYILFQGTSMASPHVAGAVVLMLQANPAFTPEDVKYYLTLATKRDQYTGSVPNDTWGYGKLDAYNAFWGLPSGPDLTAQWVSLTQTCTGGAEATHCKIKGRLAISNVGNGDSVSPTTATIYSSTDSTLGPNDTLLKHYKIGILKPGAMQNVSINTTLPIGTTATDQYIIAVITTDDVDQNNNYIPYGPVQGSDLIPAITSLAQNCTKTSKGDRCTLKSTLTVTNDTINTTSMTPTTLDVYLSQNGIPDLLLKHYRISALKRGATKNISLTTRLPYGTTATGKTIIATITTPQDSNPANNTIAYGPVP
jgi:subtilisin family serine protease